MSGTRFTLTLSPHGRLSLAQADDAPDLSTELASRLQQAFSRSSGHGLLRLGAAAGLPVSRKKPAAGRVLEAADLSGIFGLDLAAGVEPEPAVAARPARQKSETRRTGKKAKGKAAGRAGRK